jgi:hypothetical protein
VSIVARARAVALIATSAIAGCGGDPIALGPDPDLVWWTDFESCDFDDWNVTWEAGGGQLSTVASPVRSGRCAVRSQVVPQPAGTISGAMLIDPGPIPSDAYESAWFFVPETIPDVGYWVFFKLGSRTVADDPATAVDVWDFNLQPTATGGLEIAIIPRSAGVTAPAALGSPAVPIGRWFLVEAHLRASPDADGELKLWLDDTLVYERRGPTAPSTVVVWSIGSGCEQLMSPAAVIHIDDAAVATRRLGPQFPIFTRGS